MRKDEFERKAKGWKNCIDSLMNDAQLAKAINLGFGKVKELQGLGIIKAININGTLRFDYKESLQRVKKYYEAS